MINNLETTYSYYYYFWELFIISVSFYLHFFCVIKTRMKKNYKKRKLYKNKTAMYILNALSQQL